MYHYKLFMKVEITFEKQFVFWLIKTKNIEYFVVYKNWIHKPSQGFESAIKSLIGLFSQEKSRTV